MLAARTPAQKLSNENLRPGGEAPHGDGQAGLEEAGEDALEGALQGGVAARVLGIIIPVRVARARWRDLCVRHPYPVSLTLHRPQTAVISCWQS